MCASMRLNSETADPAVQIIRGYFYACIYMNKVSVYSTVGVWVKQFYKQMELHSRSGLSK